MSIYCLFIFRYNWRQMYNYYSIQEQWITVLHVSWTSSSLWVGQSSINSSTYWHQMGSPTKLQAYSGGYLLCADGSMYYWGLEMKWDRMHPDFSHLQLLFRSYNKKGLTSPVLEDWGMHTYAYVPLRHKGGLFLFMLGWRSSASVYETSLSVWSLGVKLIKPRGVLTLYSLVV